MFEFLKNIFSIKGEKELKEAKVQSSSQYKQNDKVLKAKVFSNEVGVTVEHPNGTIENCKWDEIVKISFFTTDQGPFLDDVFLALFKDEKGCLIPSEADGYNEVYEKVSKFEGFDFAKVIEAMSSATNNEFICWQKK